MAINKFTLKSGVRYQVKLRGTDGKWITRSFKTHREAKNYETKIIQQKNSGNKVFNSTNKLKVDDFVLLWHNQTSSKVSEAWGLDRLRMYKVYVKPFLGTKSLVNVRPIHIAQVLTGASALGLAEGTRLHIYNLMNNFFSDARDLFQLIPYNPVQKNLKPKVVTKETPYLSVQQSIELLKYIQGKPYELAILLNLYLGLRVGEIQYLRWKHIDLENRYVQIQGTYSRNAKTNKFKDHPKSGKWLNKRIPNELFNILANISKGNGEDFVVTSHGTNKLMDYDKYYRALKKYCREIGLPDIGTHGLRHSASEIYMDSGASRDDLRVFYGHSSNKVTDIYIHDKGDRLAKAADNIRLLRCTDS